MKQEKINGKKAPQTSWADVAIETIHAFKEVGISLIKVSEVPKDLIFHVIKTESISLTGKANLLAMILIFLIIVFKSIINMEITFTQLAIALFFLGIPSTIISSPSFVRIKEDALQKLSK